MFYVSHQRTDVGRFYSISRKFFLLQQMQYMIDVNGI